MRVAFDTSVLVAALHQRHPFHARAVAWLDAVAAGDLAGALTSHALAEVWAVLTRLPLSPRIDPRQAQDIVGRLSARFELLAVDARAYDQAIERCAVRGLRSGSVFDALHLVAAESARVDALVTFNAADFDRLSIEGSPPVVVPPDPPRVSLGR